MKTLSIGWAFISFYSKCLRIASPLILKADQRIKNPEHVIKVLLPQSTACLNEVVLKKSCKQITKTSASAPNLRECFLKKSFLDEVQWQHHLRSNFGATLSFHTSSTRGTNHCMTTWALLRVYLVLGLLLHSRSSLVSHFKDKILVDLQVFQKLARDFSTANTRFSKGL